VALLVGREHVARSSAGATIALGPSPARWQGEAHRARVFSRVVPHPRVIGGRR
jgi:hypothetical protein